MKVIFRKWGESFVQSLHAESHDFKDLDATECPLLNVHLLWTRKEPTLLVTIPRSHFLKEVETGVFIVSPHSEDI